MADDIEDRSQMRRGKPCTYIKYGIDYAINASTFMYYAPLVKLANFVSSDKVVLQNSLMKIYHEELVHLHMGQNWDISWHNGKLLPTED